MKEFSLWKGVTLVLLISLLLAGCAGNQANNNNGVVETPGSIEEAPPVEEPTEEALVPETGEQDEPEVEGTVIADPASEEDSTEGQEIIESPARTLVSHLLETEIVDQSGEKIGEVEDLAFEQLNGFIIYVIMQEEDAAGGELVAFPWQTLSAGENLGAMPGEPLRFVFERDESLLEEAPQITRDDLNELGFEFWHEDLFNYWRLVDEPMLTSGISEASVLTLMSAIENFEVIRGETNESHEVRDAVVDMVTGHLLFFVVDSSDLIEGTEGMVMIPYEYFRFDVLSSGQSGFVFNIDDATLEDLPKFDEQEFNRMQ